jgi:hypothetical protein
MFPFWYELGSFIPEDDTLHRYRHESLKSCHLYLIEISSHFYLSLLLLHFPNLAPIFSLFNNAAPASENTWKQRIYQFLRSFGVDQFMSLLKVEASNIFVFIKDFLFIVLCKLLIVEAYDKPFNLFTNNASFSRVSY